jgi:multiple sugar transport system substrate-binding protein
MKRPLFKHLAKITVSLLLAVTSIFVGNVAYATPTLHAAASGPVTITIWSPENRPDDAAAHKALIDAFELANPDIKVDLVVTTWDDHFGRLAAAKTGGGLPDIAYTWQPNTVSLMQQGFWIDISDVWASAGGASAFPAGQAKALSMKGKFYAMPFIGYPHGLWYRKDWFSKAGIKPPTTLSQLLADATVLTTKAHKGICMYNKGLDSYYLLDLMLATGAETFDSKGHLTIDSPATAKVLNFIKTVDAKKLTPIGWTAQNMDDAKLPFLAGKCAMKIDSTSFMGTIVQAHPKDVAKYGFVALPLDGGKFAGWAGASSYAIPVGAPNPDAAKKFLEFMASPANYTPFLAKEVLGFAPMVTKVALGKDLYKDARIAPYADFLKGAAAAANKGSALVGSSDPGAATKTSKVYNAQVYSEMVAMVVSGNPVANVLKWAVMRIKEVTAP